MFRNISEFQSKTLAVEIKQTFYKIKCLRTKLAENCNKAVNETPRNVYMPFLIQQKEKFGELLRIANRTCEKKFGNLADSRKLGFNPNCVVNLTNVELPIEVCHVLSYGEKFSVNPKISEIPFFDILADVENILSEIQDKHLENILRCRIINCTQNYISKHRNKQSVNGKFFANLVKKTTDFITDHNRKNPDDTIIVINTDKGNKTCVMYEKDYYSGMYELLNDALTYRKVDGNRNPTERIQKGCEKIITKALNSPGTRSNKLKLMENRIGLTMWVL
jgi:phenylpyruvate tautomerase PptA (4-oxalocrotonate tautomerase family)